MMVLVILGVLLPALHAAELTEEFAKDYVPVSYVTITGDAHFAYIDMDGDGTDDAAVVLDAATGKVRIIKFGTSEVYKKFEVPVSSSYALASIKFPDKPSLIAVGSKYLSVYNYEGKLLWEYQNLSSSVFSIITADLNGDGYENEIVAGLFNKLVAFDEKGTKLWERSISGRGDKISAIDLNQDGVSEGIAVAEGYSLSLLSPQGSLLKRFGKEFFEKRIMKVKAVDLDGDGYASELIAVDFNGNVFAFNSTDRMWESQVYYEEGTKVKILKLDGEKGVFIYSSFIYRFSPDGEKQTYYKGVANDVVAIDFNHDGRTESFAGAGDTKIYAIKDGKQVGYYLEDDEKISPYNRTGARALTPFDYDGDGVLDDLLVVNPDNQLLIVSHLKSHVSGKIIVLANLIDYALASDFFEYLRSSGYEAIHVLPENFDSYKTEKNIIILGGHKAPQGVGEIVGDLLSAEQKSELEKPGAVEMFTFEDIWAPGQRVIVLAGNTREETKQAHRKYRQDLQF